MKITLLLLFAFTIILTFGHQAVLSQKFEVPDEDTDGRILSLRDRILETRQKSNSYTEIGKIDSDWLMRAVSPKERAEFFDKWKSRMSPKYRAFFTTELDAIAASAAAKLPLQVAGPQSYPFRSPMEERLLKGEMSDVPGVIIHKIGLNQNAWLIAKNEWGLPISRYKHGMIWGRNPSSDHPYCRFWYINIIQDYAGGGTYGASYATYVGSDFAGCPAAK